MYEYCKEQVINVQAVFLSEGQIEATRSFLKLRFESANTLPGTRRFHHFEPLSDKLIGAKRVSIDKTYALQFDLVLGKNKTKAKPNLQPKTANFVVCFYDDQLWIGLVEEENKENEDFKIKFMHPHLPSRSYSWPEQDDTCFVPSLNIAAIIETPFTATGRQYKIADKDLTKINEIMTSLQRRTSYYKGAFFCDNKEDDDALQGIYRDSQTGWLLTTESSLFGLMFSKAAQNQSQKFKNLDETGIDMISCRHRIAQKAVNMFRGELFSYSYFLEENTLADCGSSILYTDVACKYLKFVRKIDKALFKSRKYEMEWCMSRTIQPTVR
eukprot:gene17067-8583_t